MAESPSNAAPSSAAALEPADPLCALNEVFHQAYDALRETVLDSLGPVIAQIEDVLILRFRGERLEGPARTRRYHELKAISHLPLALHVLLANQRGTFDEGVRGRLTQLRQLATRVGDSLEARGFTPEALERQRRLVEASVAFLDGLLAQGSVAPGALATFTHALTADLLANAEDAARDQIETMHATVEAWKERMTPVERTQLRAVVAVSHMSRPGNVAMQYFSIALGESWEGRFDQEDLQPGKRVLAAESTLDEGEAFGLLATHALDARVANRFFGEKTRMERDLLADAAERILAEMFQKEPEPLPSPPGRGP